MVTVVTESASRFSDDEEITGGGLLVRGAAAVIIDHPDGRSAALELLVAPALIEPGMNTRVIALGEAIVQRRPTTREASYMQSSLRQAWMRTVLFETAEARIAFLILAVWAAHGRPALIPVRFSYTRISCLCGVTERSVDRCMGPWVRDGRIARLRSGYSIKDLEALYDSLGASRDEIDFEEYGLAESSCARSAFARLR